MQKSYDERMTFEYHFKYYKLYQDYYSFSSIGWEYWQYPQKYSINNMLSPEQQFIFQYTVSGEGAITINSHTYSLKPGQAFLIERPSVTHYFLPKGSSHWELKFISFNSVSNNILKSIINEYGNVFTLPSSSSAMDYWETLYRLSVDNDMNNFFTASACAYAFMMHLNDTLRRIPGIHRSNNRLQTCLDTIHANYRNPLTLEQLADICSLSPSYLTKIFKDSFKVTPIQYLINYRIERACHMLLQEDLSIEDIALKNGFNSANYFSRIFKQVVGISPKKYRHEEHIEMVNSKESQQLIVHYEVLE